MSWISRSPSSAIVSRGRRASIRGANQKWQVQAERRLQSERVSWTQRTCRPKKRTSSGARIGRQSPQSGSSTAARDAQCQEAAEGTPQPFGCVSARPSSPTVCWTGCAASANARFVEQANPSVPAAAKRTGAAGHPRDGAHAEGARGALCGNGVDPNTQRRGRRGCVARHGSVEPQAPGGSPLRVLAAKVIAEKIDETAQLRRLVGSNPAMRFQPLRLGKTNQNWIGRSPNAANPNYRGLVDELRIYRGALGPAQVAALAAAA